MKPTVLGRKTYVIMLYQEGELLEFSFSNRRTVQSAEEADNSDM